MALNDATRSYLIPVGDLTLAERLGVRTNVDSLLLDKALDVKVGTQLDQLLVRDTLPSTDLALAVPAALSESWMVAGPGVAGTDLQFFSSLIAIDRCIGFFGVSPETVPLPISRVRLTLGAASAETRGVYQLESLYGGRLETMGYFSEPVIFIRNETVRVMVMPRLAFGANAVTLPLLARTVEPIGPLVSRPAA